MREANETRADETSDDRSIWLRKAARGTTNVCVFCSADEHLEGRAAKFEDDILFEMGST